jgi:sensor histidine kinase YesM
MVLQPLVENAFKHALAGRTSGAKLEVTARRQGDELVLTVRDNGPGVTRPVGTGIGIKNTTDRLHALYGNRYRFSLRNRDDGAGAVAEVTLPYHLEPEVQGG